MEGGRLPGGKLARAELEPLPFRLAHILLCHAGISRERNIRYPGQASMRAVPGPGYRLSRFARGRYDKLPIQSNRNLL